MGDGRLPESLGYRQLILRNFGFDAMRKDVAPAESSQPVGGDLLTQYGAREGQWNQPITIFATQDQQQVDGSILSRGYDRDGFERVLIRGEFEDWDEQTLLGKALGRWSFSVQSAGKSFVVYMGKSVKVHCQQKTFYDKDGKVHDLTKAFVDYEQKLDEAQLEATTKVLEMFGSGDDMATVVRHSDGVMEALLLVGFDCNI